MNALCLFLQAVLVIAVSAIPVEDTHLVTMRKAEMMEIVDCISKSKNPLLCQKFETCEMLQPPQVFLASDVCKKECASGGLKKCSHHEPLFLTYEIPAKIFDCIAKKTHKLSVEDRQKMVMFEKCLRDLHTMTCKMPKRIP